VGGHRSNGERKYHLSNLPGDTSIKDVAGAIRLGRSVSRRIKQLREELWTISRDASGQAFIGTPR
jgi:hypothetical protein